MEHRGQCFGAPYTDVDGQLAKNWYIKEKYRLKFSMDFFNLFNHPNFNSGNLEGSNFTASNLLCGGPTGGGTTCTPTNNVVSGGNWPGSPTPSGTTTAAGFGAATAIQGVARQLQYTLRFSF
jgi:hypothetical protein